MNEISRIGVSVEEELLQSFDQLISDQGYVARSEALRDLMRDALIKSRLENSSKNAEVLGSLTLVYDHHASELNYKMNELQHEHHNLVVSVLHVHVNHDDCMEVIVLRGAMHKIRKLSDGLLSLKGVKHGRLFITLSSEKMTGRKSAPNGHTNSRNHTH